MTGPRPTRCGLQRGPTGSIRRDRLGDYIDYGHTPPGRGPKGARDDYEHAVDLAGGVIRYDIDALVAHENTVAAAWTGRRPNGSELRGLSVYAVAEGRVAEVRHALIGELPGEFHQP